MQPSSVVTRQEHESLKALVVDFTAQLRAVVSRLDRYGEALAVVGKQQGVSVSLSHGPPGQGTFSAVPRQRGEDK